MAVEQPTNNNKRNKFDGGETSHDFSLTHTHRHAHTISISFTFGLALSPFLFVLVFILYSVFSVTKVNKITHTHARRTHSTQTNIYDDVGGGVDDEGS